mmetsp:Transcript_781/g.1917  ORF Transcript_781/g.1917 Transcript_781/m.1917 type:complete len:322 (-) Transcript_781:155-1120(-)|eukprot:CAMPEP_0170602022 /NCGR_PEP_ID=MMETSP0224-20130122/18171_1 /TAXON_ID=285029 /ORGANISM="Togula jolla, Strain CCCM 725" /LENGTH=321 /DNA_ID=CAMNT_0010926837 /DNA_START=39 /DNA_END=1004 /DNA_ORIENTATION=-
MRTRQRMGWRVAAVLPLSATLRFAAFGTGAHAPSTRALATPVMQSAAALETAKLDAQQKLEEMKKEGVLGMRRPVRIVATPHVPGSPVAPGVKVVHLIRHGQGFHNLFTDVWRFFTDNIKPESKGELDKEDPAKRTELVDPPLTALGRQQARALQPQTKQLKDLELVVVSPFRRATETALVAFNHLVQAPAGTAGASFLGHSNCGERRHENVADLRRTLLEIKEEFPNIDWSGITEETDELWSATASESWRKCSDRAYDFLLWLRSRPEKEVAVATHSAWLFALTNTVTENKDPALSEWFQTGEMRSVTLEFIEGEGKGDL